MLSVYCSSCPLSDAGALNIGKVKIKLTRPPNTNLRAKTTEQGACGGKGGDEGGEEECCS